MDGARWQRIQTLFHEAADLPPQEQRALLEAECGSDERLMADVLSLLQEDARGASLLDRGVADVAHRMLDEAGRTTMAIKEIGPYRIKQVLGEGGMGVVYLAERQDLGSLVAIKILRDAWLSPARRERFASEQRTLAQLNHPSIARLYDADTLADGTPCFVMEYVDGAPLTEYCERHECTIEQRLQLMRSVCEAVQHAHRHAIIHRDLKPSNILVKADGTIRLVDFGIAKQIEALDAGADQTRTGLRLMTPAYAAPEQVRGGRVGIHTDVYALGVILYELLAGELPFDLSNRTPGEAELMIVGQEPERPSARAKRQSGEARIPQASRASWADLDVLCLTAMHKDPQRRYGSVEALIRDIDHYLKGEPLEARPDTLRYRAGKFVRRHRRGVTAAALVSAVVVALVIFFTVRLAIARNTALAEAARTQRIQRFTENLFEGGDKEAGPADDLRVVTLLERGVREARSLDADPAVQADLYETLGAIYQKLGKLDQADALLSGALAVRRRLLGPDAPDVARSLIALGLLRLDQARLQEAEQLVRQGLEIDRRKLAAKDSAIPRAMTALGRVLEERGAYDEAIRTLNEAVSAQPAGAATADLAASLLELANTHFYAGHFEISDALNRRLLGIHRRLYGDRHPLVAEDLINLGAIQVEKANYREAERLDREALEIVEAWYGKDHPKTASSLTLIGRSLVYQDRYDEARGLLQQALAIQERVYGNVHPRIASALNELGNAAARQGQYDAAERYFTRMIEIYRAVYGENHYLLATAQSNLASVYLARNEYARAEKLYRKVIALYTRTLSANHTSTGIARTKLGRTLLRERRFAEAQVESLAGYGILSRQMSPTASWIRNARQDLAEEYDALNQPEQARSFRAEPAGMGRKDEAAAGRK